MRPHALLLALLLGLPAASRGAPPADPTLKQIDAIVAANFYAPKLLAERGWPAAVERAQAELAEAKGADARTAVFQRLMASLGTSHTDYLPRSDPRYWDLASIFQRVLEKPSDRCPDRSKLPPMPITVEGIGVWWERHDDKWFIAGVLDGGPAQQYKFTVGHEIVAADGAPFDPIASFAGQAGKQVELSYRYKDAGVVAIDPVIVERVEPVAQYLAATRASAKVIERGGRRIGYLRLWSGVGDGLIATVREALRELNQKDIDGFVLDLRDGWGGVPPEFVSLFDANVPKIVTKTRTEEHSFDTQIHAPAAVLINEGSRSGKEVLAHAIRKGKLATLVGERTAGAMLGGSPFCLDDGALLYLAVGESRIDGEVLEGKGVEPDVVVPFDVRYAWGKDPQLDAALDHVVNAAR